MAKETKAQRTAREAAAHTMYLEEQRTTYHARLLAVLERAQDSSFELRVKDGMYTLYDRNERRPETVVLTPWYTDFSEDTLNSLLWNVESKEAAEKEANSKFLAKQTALAKLSKEEKELLGL